MSVEQPRKAIATGLVLFIAFLCYYTLTASLLPIGAGPDYAVSNDISRFVYDHYSIPTFPENADDLMYTPGGTTRATRPPASYIVSGFLAHLSPYQETQSFLAWRHGTGFTSALALLVVFATLYMYFQSTAYALAGAFLLGLMPQFTFIASYNNDDSAGILSASLVIMSMVFILRQGVNTKTIAIMAASCGFVLLTKFTAWLVLPFAAIFTFWQARRQYRIWWKYLLVSLPIVVVCGGWWILFNIYHYGWTDPLQFGIGKLLIETHRTKIYEGSGGFITQGVGYYQLLFDNHNNFVSESIKSLIGNLDWLRLPLGIYQYIFYVSIICIAFLYAVIILISGIVGRNASTKRIYPARDDIMFTVVLLAMIAFQVFMYVRFNLLHDIQLQGKYILPVMPAIMILFFGAISMLHNTAAEAPAQNGKNKTPVKDGRPHILVPSIVMVALFVHIDAYLHYVIPFYSPPAYALAIKNFKSVDLNRENYIEKEIRLSVQGTPEGSWLIESNGKDPQILMKPSFCDVIDGYSMIDIDIFSTVAGSFVIYIDNGEGFDAKQRVFAKYEKGNSRLLIASGLKPCKRVRIDPMEKHGQVIIKSISVAPLTVSPKR